tara:strand:+ start:508 stop:1272 length:765 start_codon:yes stop_codon:yes gene_type:complete
MGKIIQRNKIMPVILAAGYGSRLGSKSIEPKALLKINSKSIIEYTIEYLIQLGFTEIFILVGYKKELIKKSLTKYKNKIKVNFYENKKFRISGHGYSLYSLLNNFSIKNDLLIIHGDLFFDNKIINLLLKNEKKNIIMIDEKFSILTNDEVVVLGKNNKVSRIVKFNNKLKNIVGEIVGINKWSLEFQKKYMSYCKKLFKNEGINFNWEPIIDRMLLENEIKSLNFNKIYKKKWININYKEDYAYAKKISKLIL